MDSKLVSKGFVGDGPSPSPPTVVVEQRWKIVKNKGAVSTIIITPPPFTPSTVLVSETSPLRLLHNRKIVKKINQVSKHFHFYASVNLQNISDLEIKILLNRRLQIGSYGETSCGSTVRLV